MMTGKDSDVDEDVEADRDDTYYSVDIHKDKDKITLNNNVSKDENESNDTQNLIINPDLTKDNPIRSSTIEELKAKLGSKEVEEHETEAMIPETQRGVPHPPPPPHHFSEEGLIIPRRIINPIAENAERQNLHKELLFNQKMGKNVLNQKSELQRVFDKHKDNIAKKELDTTNAAKQSEFKKVIAERAKRLEENNAPTEIVDDKGLNNAFLQARAKLKPRLDSK